MTFDEFQDLNSIFSIVLFIQTVDYEKHKEAIERLGQQSNVLLVVQPCPYEGIEFLYRVSLAIPGHKTSLDKDVFWQAIVFRKGIEENDLREVSKHHYEYLRAILEQDADKMVSARKVLESLTRQYI